MPIETRAVEKETLDPHGSSFWYGFGILALALALLLSLVSYPIVVSDYTYFVKPWFDTLHSHLGLTAFREPFADYAPAYLYLLKLLTLLPLSSLATAKTLSVLFSAFLAGIGYLILKRTLPRLRRSYLPFLAGVTLFCLPTVMMNAALWGQSDALFSTGVMASLLGVLTDAPLFAAIAFGIAISFKQQAVFFLPILVGYLLRRQGGWKYLFVPPLVFFLSVIPAWLSGGSLRYWLFIYLAQAHEYPWLSVSAQSIFAFLQPLSLSTTATSVAFWLGVAASASVALACIIMLKKMKVLVPTHVALISLASALLLPYLLPRMHERYFFLADILSVLYAFYCPRRSFIPVFVVGTSLMSYMPFLSGQVSFLSWAHVDLRVPALLLLIPIGAVLYDLWKERLLYLKRIDVH